VRRTVDLVRAATDADLHVTNTRDPDALRAWLDERVSGYRTVVIAGGDGSLGIAYNVLHGRAVVIGYIPAGFGNATAHLLNLPTQPERLADLIRAADSRPLDLVRVQADGIDRLALFASIGWDAVVARRYADAGARGLLGWAAAVAGSVPDLWRRATVSVTADGRVAFAGPMELLVAGTTPYYGRGLLANPGARPDKGRLTARVYPGPAPSFFLEAVRWVAERAPRAEPIEAAHMEVQAAAHDGLLLLQADGDVLGERSAWRFTIVPRAARLIGRW
jgi:diacylglycerol kinase (ATP)